MDKLCKLIHSKKMPLEITSSGLKNIEIMPKGITKGCASLYLAKYLKIGNDNVLVIGDEKNDISMLKSFKNSVTLLSSKDVVRKAAKIVIDAQPSEIVKKAIERLVFENE
jgi:hydroxymethylpyrimidine pyrophosphatase-like HAD family hydrolase